MDDLFLLKLALEKLNDKLEKFESRFGELEDRVCAIENKVKLKITEATASKVGEFEDELLDTKQVRKFLGISHNTLQAIVSAGKLAQLRVNARSVRYSKKNLMSYVESLA